MTAAQVRSSMIEAGKPERIETGQMHRIFLLYSYLNDCYTVPHCPTHFK